MVFVYKHFVSRFLSASSPLVPLLHWGGREGDFATICNRLSIWGKEECGQQAGDYLYRLRSSFMGVNTLLSAKKSDLLGFSRIGKNLPIGFGIGQSRDKGVPKS